MNEEVLGESVVGQAADLASEPATVSIVIPAYNEAQAISRVLADVQRLYGERAQEIIVVDDGSTDNTGALAEAAGCRVIRHARNRGYGASLKTGIRASQSDYILTMDADGQHRAEDVLAVLSQASGQDMVVGARTALVHSAPWRMPGKWLLGFMANYLTRQRIPDLNSGLRVMRRAVVLRYVHLCPDGFSFSTTITMALLYRRYEVLYVPITVKPRIGKSTVSVRTGLDTLILIVRIASLFDPLRIFLPIGLVLGLSGLLWSIPYALAGRGVSVGAMLAIFTALLFGGLGILCDQISQLRLERYE